jgi:hypothetical protein
MANEPVKQKPTNAPVAMPAGKPRPASDIDTFQARVRAMQIAKREQATKGRLIFALDATASRQPTWDAAAQRQFEMFREVRNLEVQLVYYRGSDECKASGWAASGEKLGRLMGGIMCRAGTTQIGEVLTHCCEQSRKQKVEAVVFVGDAFEENIDLLAATADELGRLGTKVFMFQEFHEGNDAYAKAAANAEAAFREIARMTHGAYCRFDAGAPGHLAELLRAVAAYVGGGVKALSTKAGAMRMLRTATPWLH